MPTQLRRICQDFEEYTKRIRKAPHDPQVWLSRAVWFAGYGVPYIRENHWPLLAAADAYKVYKWFSCPKFRRENHLYDIPGAELRETKLQACRILVKALLDLKDIQRARYYVKEEGIYESLCKEDQSRLRRPLSEDYRPKMRAQQYPWIPARFMDRTRYLHNIRENLASRGLALIPSRIGKRNENNLGVFAMKRFKKGEPLFEEKTLKPSRHTLHSVFHFFDAAIKELKKGAPRHLLDRSELGALAASYNDHENVFRFRTEHLGYLKAKDPRLLWNTDLDMWVLDTAHQRCSTNQFGLTEERADRKSIRWSVISPMASLFQHSCEPVAQWGPKDKECADMMVMTAIRNIEQGEEIYDSYCDDGDLEWRREQLKHWIGGDCMCTKCVKEERAKAERDTNARDSGVEMTDSATTSPSTGSSSEVDSDGDAKMGGTS
ncbi:hypothetical protein FKW77_007852 [Venturia effusa]|uniref:SET domain-containing protein n=1 Tax=Venturia effusa TaxID=50376 RepID=A0A517L1N1_9PEZI|nr:hypothetical protein FKW77_007852 [Venturia effusa]